MKLVYKFSLLVFGIVFVVLSTITFLLILIRTQEIQSELTDKNTAISSVLLAEFGQYFTDYYFYQYDTYREIVTKKLLQYPDLLNFRMYNSEGGMLFDSSMLQDSNVANAFPAVKTDDPIVQDNINSRQVYTDIILFQGEKAIRVIAHHIDKYDIHRSTFEFYFSMQSVRQATRDMIMIFLLALLSFSLVSVGITVILVKRIIKPIGQLTKLAKEVAEGKVVTDIAIDTNDEIGLLSQAFSQMANDLKISREKLEKQNISLEDEVKKRTNELQKQIDEMSRMQKLMVNRELRMIELKKQLEEAQKKV